MRILTAAWLVALLLGNAVFGVLGAGLLCLHADFGVHLEKADVAPSHCADEAPEEVFLTASRDGCPPCVDVELRGDPLTTLRANGGISVSAAKLLEAFLPHTVVEKTVAPSRWAGSRVLRVPPTLEPPEILITRTTVFQV